jgi:hypothetical protein
MVLRVKRFLTVCALLYVVGHPIPADADVIVLGMDDADVEAHILRQDGGIGSVYDPTVSPFLGSAGVFNIYNYESCSIGGILRCQYSVLEILFHTPTDLIQLTSQFYTDGPRVLLYDIFNNPLAIWHTGGGFVGRWGDGFTTATQTYTDLGQQWQQDLTLARPSADIARVVIGGDNPVLVRQVSYQVPEPSTLGLVVLGLATSLLRRRRTSRLSQ